MNKERYCKITHKIQKTWFVDIPENIEFFLKEDAHPEEFMVEDVYMTKEEFNNLPEFNGF